jgi:glycosyltransferase involved in cell wall biosynthesis
MRVAIIDPSLFTLPYDVALAAGLEAAGHQVTLHGRDLRAGEALAASITLQPDFYRLSERSTGAMLPGPVRLIAKGLDHAGSLLRLTAQLRRQKPNVIHFQWLALPMFDRLALSALRRFAPLVLTVHDTDPFNGDPSAGLQLRGFRSCLQQFDALIVHTEQGRQRLQKFGLEARRISVIPHGLLHQIGAAAPQTQDARLTFLMFGKIKPYKGTDVAIAAFAALPEALRRRARLRIIGRPYMDIIPLRRAAEGLGDSVSLETDFVAEADIASLYDQNTVALFPYREIEASGVLFITLAFGRPIIASKLCRSRTMDACCRPAMRRR